MWFFADGCAMLQKEFEEERAEIDEEIRVMEQTLKLKMLVLDAFVPPEHIKLIEDKAYWEAHTDSWTLPGQEFASNNIQREGQGMAPVSASMAGLGVGFRRKDPVAHFARQVPGMLRTLGVAGHSGPATFDPAARTELTPEIQQALVAALTTDTVRVPRDQFFTYQVEKPAAAPKKAAAKKAR